MKTELTKQEQEMVDALTLVYGGVLRLVATINPEFGKYFVFDAEKFKQTLLNVATDDLATFLGENSSKVFGDLDTNGAITLGYILAKYQGQK